MADGDQTAKPKRGRGRPRLSDEERLRRRKTGKECANRKSVNGQIGRGAISVQVQPMTVPLLLSVWGLNETPQRPCLTTVFAQSD